MEQDNTQQPNATHTDDDGLKVLLNPDYYQKLKEDERRKELELTDEEKKSGAIKQESDSMIGGILQDLLNLPEKSKWYRDHVLFPTIEERYFPERVDDNPNVVNVEIPIISMSF